LPRPRRRSPGACGSSFATDAFLFRQLDYQPGAPENPLSPAEVETKFRANARPALGGDGADELLAAVRSLEVVRLPQLGQMKRWAIARTQDTNPCEGRALR